MSTDVRQREVQRHQKELARLQQDKSRETAKVAEETRRADQATSSASRVSSDSSKKSKLRDAQRRYESAVRHQKRVADIEAKIARAQAQLNDAHRSLTKAQEEDSRRRKREQDRAVLRQEREMSDFNGRLTQHDRLHRVALSAIEKLQRLPERITVLFLAANPLDQQQLRLDEEARAIREMIRKSLHRDAVHLESRWAVRPLDVLQAINECCPRIVHFSGHGSDQDEIIFQDSSGQTKKVTKEAIVQTMAAGSDEIQLVFFNTCYSASQAKDVVKHVPAAIGMTTSIGDEAAREFSAQFYSAIGFGLSVSKAFEQGKAALMLERIPEESVPKLFVTEGLDPATLVLVKPL